MLVNFNDSNSDITSTTFDICIVGSGLGGAFIAMELVKFGKKVLLIESGDFDGDIFKSEKESQELFGMPITHLNEVGGTSNIWGGVCAPFDEIDFQRKFSEEHGSWPIKYHEVRKYYEEACVALRLSQYKFFKKNLSLDLFSNELLSNKIYQYKKSPLQIKKILKDFFTEYSNGILLYNCSVYNFDLNNHKEISNLNAVNKNKSKHTKIYAKEFILSAGALRTPLIFQNSDLSILSKEMVKNIGSYLIDHPMANLMKVKFKKLLPSKAYHRINLNKNIRIKSSLSLRTGNKYNHNFYLIPSFSKDILNNSERVKRSLIALRKRSLSINDIFNLIKYPLITLQLIFLALGIRPKTKIHDCWVISEQRPNINNKVSLKNENKYELDSVIKWDQNSFDIDSVYQLYDDLKLVFGSDIEILHEKRDIDWLERSTSAAHHMGTMRMSKSFLNGVVDKNLKVFGLKNAYISDASVIPVSGNSNPGLTVVALSLRLADLLRKDINNVSSN